MQKVMGIGGVFFKTRTDKAALLKWYADNLGVDVQGWGGTQFEWAKLDHDGKAATVWSVFDKDSDYFGERDGGFMINFRVLNLDAMLAQLRANGCDVLDKLEESEYGRFGWVTDPEGNRVELWQPPA